jgi:hypothetical protein
MRIGRIMVALAALPLAAGCTAVVGGAARPAPGLTPRPLIGQAVSRALLDDGELAKLLGQYFKSAPDSRPAGTAVNVAHRMMDKVSSLT